MAQDMDLGKLLNPEAEKALVAAGLTKAQAALAVKTATPFIVANALGQAAASFDFTALIQRSAEMFETAEANEATARRIRSMFHL